MVKLVEKRNPDPLFYSAGFVFFTQVVHVGLILSIIKKLFSIQYPVFSDTYLINKLSMMPFALIWLIIVHVYFKKRYSKLKKLYAGQKIVSLKNTVIVFSVLLIPLVIMILLLSK
jgi:hypothetical protein